jgi:hypothetical protein
MALDRCLNLVQEGLNIAPCFALGQIRLVYSAKAVIHRNIDKGKYARCLPLRRNGVSDVHWLAS